MIIHSWRHEMTGGVTLQGYHFNRGFSDTIALSLDQLLNKLA